MCIFVYARRKKDVHLLCVLGYPALGKECIYHVNLNQSSDLSLAVVQAIAFRGSNRIYVSLDDASIEVSLLFSRIFWCTFD